MNIKAILFDLDGTLLPMDQDAFTRAYFKELAGVIAPLGIEPKKLVDVVWAGHASRLSWVGLKPGDFDMVTSYETDRYCKPNPAYYSDICARIGFSPEECLMVGNDETEDMLAASSIGMNAIWVTDCMIPAQNSHWDGPKGPFTELIEYLKAI